ncbi:MAG: AraC family transcriptional regulator [Alphaproteobacteria bacterium]|nr:AraC family transcriptional regulator [Alphaproteobacteria bacterium]
MSAIDRFQVARPIHMLCAVLKLSPEHVLRRAGLPTDYLANETRGVTAAKAFDVWNAVDAEAKRPDLPLFLGKTFVKGPFNPAVFSFSCSPNTEIGLTRLAIFKPLVAPIILSVKRQKEALWITLRSSDDKIRMPATMAAFELVYFIELVRLCTCEHIIPLSVGIPAECGNQHDLETDFGVHLDEAEIPTIVLSLEDARRPLISENEALWADLERGLNRELMERNRSAPTHERVKSALLEMLPSGRSTADDVCLHLNMSKRSLHRYLKSEGYSFQALLDETRSELSLYYLSRDDVSVEEISYLLAYRDPNSFYRAFRGWTGLTPLQARENRIQ